MSLRHRVRRDRGEATVELVVLTPLLLLLVLLLVQMAAFWHAAAVAEAAASQGASAAAAGGLDPGTAAGVATEVAGRTVTELGSRANGAPVATISGDGDATIIVTVQVVVPHLVPFFPAIVSRTVMVPRERFVAESQR